jgi:hypothetical protein
MLELSMASLGSRQIPTTFFKKPEDLLDLHALMIRELRRTGKSGEPIFWSS